MRSRSGVEDYYLGSGEQDVSLLFALSDTRTSLLVREAYDRAVAAAWGYLEREAGEVRRGGVDRLPGGGFVAAAFRPCTTIARPTTRAMAPATANTRAA